jgi:hypothetical protein
MNMLDPFMPPLALANIMEIKLRASRQATAPKAASEIDSRAGATGADASDTAAHGDDDLMSEPSPPMPSSATPDDGVFTLRQWLQQVDAARATWDRLNMVDLLCTEGDEDELIKLVQRRYAISHDEATRQVQTFFQEQTS